ncbi:MAG TPA: APC family permease [Steroidobacteraceae bacterium]|jgi:amino acid transporter|nr:APC family permease [Steroidobacteraceae bacterium]
MSSPSNQYDILRGIGRWDLVALMVNITIGSGILGLPAKLFALTGVYSVLALVLCAILVAIVAICFAEVGSRFTHTGGPYLFTRTAFGATPGFIVGWLYWVSRVLTFATICNLLVVYLARMAPALQGPAARVVIISVVVVAIWLVNLVGIRQATIVSNGLTTLKVTLLLVFGVIGILTVRAWPAAPATLPPAADFSDAMLLGIFAFVGFEAALVAAGETRNPRRDVPFAVALSLLIVLILYAGVQIVCIAAVPALATSTAPFADAAVVLWGPTGEHVITLGAVVIMLGSLNSGFLATSRLPFAFAEQGDMPAVLARVHPKFRTPHVAILASAVLVWLATVASSFLSAITLATSTRMVVYIAGCLALITLRRRADAPAAGFVAPLGPAVAVLSSVLCFALLANASSRELIQLAIAAIVGALLLVGVRALSKRQ